MERAGATPPKIRGRQNVRLVSLLCPACASRLPDTAALRGRDRLHGLPGRFEVVVCRDCGTGRTLPPVASADLGELYPDTYTAHGLPESQPARAAAVGLFRWRMWRALRRPPLSTLAQRAPGRLLDVGSGRGDLGVVIGERGWSVTGLEPSPAARAAAEERGVSCVEGTLDTAAGRLEPGYDAAAFLHSLEHVAEPLDDLRTVHGLLRAGGALVISLPNFASAQARRFRSSWFHLDLPRHRSHFTPRGLEALLPRAGFDVASITTTSSADGLPMSLRYRRSEEPPARSPLAIAGVLALSPLGAAHDRLAGSGDFLHAVGVRRD
jgi:SAM-dependent methyltransferase